MSDELDSMRTSLLPSLLSVARYNQNRTAERVDVFELARVYRGKRPDGLADERIRLTVLARVDADPDAGRRGFLRLKSVMDRFAQDLVAGTVRYLRASADLYHPSRTASIIVGGSEIGVVGELHPSTRCRGADRCARPAQGRRAASLSCGPSRHCGCGRSERFRR